MSNIKLIKKNEYYEGVVYEFNLPVGWSCPNADVCLVKVDRNSGKQDNRSSEYKCYAAGAERFPSVRDSRWHNFDLMKMIPSINDIQISDNVKHIRVHSSGDFFNQKYFDLWIEIAKKYPDIEFWTYTKSIQYWLNRINDIPDNFVINASLGGKQDHLIDKTRMKYVEIAESLYNASYAVDKKDDLARIPFKYLQRFSLVDNFSPDNKKR